MARKILIQRLLLVCVAALQCNGTVASFVAFGDSYSDDGHGANVAVHSALGTTQVIQQRVARRGDDCSLQVIADNVQEASGYFPREPYQQGRFSNGPIYLETAAASVGNNLDSFAAGGAVTGAPGSSSILPVYPPYDSLSQVANVAVPTGLQQV